MADWLSGVRRSEELRVTKIKGTNEGERINEDERGRTRTNEDERTKEGKRQTSGKRFLYPVICAYSGPLDLSGDYQGV